MDVEGERGGTWRRTRDELADVRPETTVVLLPGKDDWVMGPGTKDTWVVPAEHRTAMTRGANPVRGGRRGERARGGPTARPSR